MKTTSLEKLIKADSILQVQLQYSKSIIKQSDALDQQIRAYQKRLSDNKLEKELELNSFIDSFYESLGGIKIPDFYLNGRGGPGFRDVPGEARAKYQREAESINNSIAQYDEEMECHMKLKKDRKKLLRLISKYYREHQLKDILATTDEEMPSIFNERTIKLLLKNVNKIKKHVYSFNRMWKATLIRDKGYLELFVALQDQIDYDRLHPFEWMYRNEILEKNYTGR